MVLDGHHRGAHQPEGLGRGDLAVPGQVDAADEFARLLENHTRTAFHEEIKRATDRRIGRNATRRVGAPAHRADDQITHRHLHPRHFGNLATSTT